MKRICLVIILIYPFVISSGQKLPAVDSMLKRLEIEKSDTGKITLYYRISHELQFSDTEKSFLWAEKALEESERTGFRQGTANALVQLGNLEQLSGNYEKAENYNILALRLFEKNGPKSGIAVCYNNLGIIAHSRNEYSVAVEYYRKSLALNRLFERRSGEATSLFCLGTVYENTTMYDSALIYYLEAEKISEELNDNKLIAYARISLANVYYSMGDLKSSAHYNLEAAELYLHDGNDLGLIKVYSSLGQIFTQMDSLVEATRFYRLALVSALKLGSKSNISNSFYYLAEVYEQRQMADSAYFFYNYAYNTYSEIEDTENSTYSLISMARIENSSGRHNAATIHLTEALKNAERIETPLPLREVYRELALNSAGSGDYRKAWLYQQKFSAISDSVMNIEKQNQILDLQTRYETEKKEKENEILKKDQRILRITKSFLITGTSLLLLIALVIYRSLKIKKRDNRLLRTQKEEISRQRDIVEQQKGEITGSIRYAKRIQSAMLTPDDQLVEVIPDSFVLYLPRDIVSGDFYFIRKVSEDKTVICASDCTGHGVPGAMMSMLGISLLTDIINNELTSIASGITKPSSILDQLRQRIKTSLRQTGKDEETKDGMDMALCIFDKKTRELQYAGANNPIYFVTDHKLNEIKATRNPIGIYLAETGFTDTKILLPENTSLYLFSDGYVDQINPKRNKYMSKNFERLLEEIYPLDMKEQQAVLLKSHLDFKQNEEQVDDILVIGVRF